MNHNALNSPTLPVMPLTRLLRAYCLSILMELRGALRAPDFAIPFLLIPMAIYVLFGVIIIGYASMDSPYGPGLADYMFSGFSVLAVVMPCIFGGVGLAAERQSRVLLLRRALPTPPGAVVLAKISMAVGTGAVSVALVAALALAFGNLTISVVQVAILVSALVLGSVAFACIGLLIGTLSSAAAAPAWGLVVFLPQVWLSGLFIPLPDFLKPWVILWPTFHLNQFALGAAGVSDFIFIPLEMAATVLIAISVLCGGLAIYRLQRTI